MSLLGSLEDLSLTDIVQIVFLSRRTGVLEIVDAEGRHTILFRQGLIVNASAPEHPDLITYLVKQELVPRDAVKTVRQMEDKGIPCGTALAQLNLLSHEELANAVRERILSVVGPLIQSREGEFNFLLSESMEAIDVEYEAEGGFPPQTILAGPGERASRPQSPGLSPGDDGSRAGRPPAAGRTPAVHQFKVAGGLIEVESPDARHVVLFERNPLVRVAAKRAFTRNNVKIAQFGSLNDARAAMTDLFRSNTFFVTLLEVTPDTQRFVEQIKRRNARLPVAVIDTEDDPGRRHDLLDAGADLYLTKPALSEGDLSLFADELVLFAERAFEQWEALGGSFGAEEMLEKFDALETDIAEVAVAVLRLSSKYLDRAALFIASEDEFVGLGGFGLTGGGEDMAARIKKVRIFRREPSILRDVAESRQVHRGKLQRTPANVQLIERMGNLVPTEVVALPIMHGEQTIGILYGDNAEHRAPIDSMPGLEVFLSHAGYAFGQVVGRGGA